MNRLLQESLVLQHRFAVAASHADIDEPEVGTYEYMLRQDSLRKWPGPIKAVLSVAWSVGAFFAKCYVIDATGKVVDEAHFSFSYEHQQRIEMPADLAESEPKFSLDTIAFEELFDTGTETLLEDFDPRFLARLQRPTLSDPLSFTVSESLLEIGRLCNLNVVARPYDDFYHGDPLVRGIDLGLWLAGIERYPGAHMSLGDGWLIIGPSGFRMTPQIDRRALETLLDQSRNRLPTLPEVSTYAVVSTDSLLELVYMTPFAGFYPEWTWYKFYGKLPEDVRSALWRGEPVPVRTLPANAREFVEWILDNEISNPTHYDEFTDFDSQSLPVSEWLPNGLPADLMLLPKLQSDACFLLAQPRRLRARSVVRSLDDMGRYAANRHFAGMSDSLTFPWYLGSVRIGSSRELTIRLVIGERTFEHTLQDVDLSRRSKVYAGPELPDEVQKSFESAARRNLKRLQDDGGDPRCE